MFWLIPIAIGAAALLSSSSDSDSSSSYDDSAEREAERQKAEREKKKQKLRQEITQFYNGELNKLAHKLGNTTYAANYYNFVDIEDAQRKKTGVTSTIQDKVLQGSDINKAKQQLKQLDIELAKLSNLEKRCLTAHQYLKTLRNES